MKLRKIVAVTVSCATSLAMVSCGKKTEKVVELSFNSNGGSIVENYSAVVNSKIDQPTKPTKKGYDFVGWFSDENYSSPFSFSAMPNENTTVYAKWTLKNYNVTYYLNGGKNNTSNPSSYNILQNDITLLDPTYTNHFFGGWYTDSDFSKEITKIDTDLVKDLEIFAKWTTAQEEEIVTYHITYNTDGGVNGNNPTEFNKNNANINLLPAVKEGYIFKGWYTDLALTKPIYAIDTKVNSDYVLYAKWEKETIEPQEVTYSINYNLDGGNNSSKNPFKYKEEDGVIILEAPTRVSCTFKGWYRDEAFLDPIEEIDCSQKQDLNLYAKWVVGIYEVCHEFDLGIGKEYVIYHITDTHINAGTTASDKEYEASRVASRYGYADSFGEKYDVKSLASTSVDNFNNILKYVNNEAPKAVCYTGDLMDYYSKANYDFINEKLKENVSPYIYSLGNHENPSSNYDGMSGLTTTEFTVLEFDDFEIVCLDNSTDNGNGYYYTENQYNLLYAETLKNKPIIIAQHVPLLTEENCSSRIEKCGTYFFIDVNSCDLATAKVANLICTNDNIKLILCGHIHGGTVTYVAPNKPQVTCSLSLIGTINRITIR